MKTETEPRTMFDAIDDLARLYPEGYSPRQTAEEMMAYWAKKSKSDPLVREYIKSLPTNKAFVPPITEPWMALAEQRIMAGLIGGSVPEWRVLIDHPGREQAELRARLATTLWMSQTFLWSSSVIETLKSCPMPAHVISRDQLPFPYTYHSYQNAFDSVDVITGELQGTSDWMALAYGAHGAHGAASIFVPITSPDQSVVITLSALTFGERFPDAFGDKARATGMVLSMLAFLRSAYVEVEQRQMPRQWRRGNGILAEDSEAAQRRVNVVTLRRSARESVEAYNAESREFKHRWWVSGHFRSQWYPSTQSHEVVWVAPYIKGHPDAPMLDKVFSVRRL